MRFKFKQFLYLANDITNALLEKDRINEHELVDNLKRWVIILAILLFLSTVCNLVLIVAK
jgi:hypothetical protein